MNRGESESVRLDVYLAEEGFAKSRTMSARLIEKGRVKINGETATKRSLAVFPGDAIEVLPDEETRYVSRGGLKLEAALDAFGFSPAGLVCADIGASTGGFTDCLLKRGAARVYAIENGSAQLDPSLAADERVISLENVNARYMTEETLPEKCALAVMDVSFISQTLIYDAIMRITTPDAVLISLIKPQFETEIIPDGRRFLGKGGVIRDANASKRIADALCASAEKHGFVSCKTIVSPVTGGDGNTEYLSLFRKVRSHHE